MSFFYEHVPFFLACALAVPAHAAVRTPVQPRIVVLGIGNVQWGDVGFGMHAIERLKAGWQCASHVEFVAGGTQGLALLPLVESAQRMIVFNAADFGRPPGTLCVREGDDAVQHLHTRPVSMHQMDFADALACAQLKGHYPRELVLIGVQPLAHDDYGTGLGSAVSAQLGPAVAVACRWLRRWHAQPRPLTQPDAADEATVRAGSRIDAPHS
ncbi:MAG TPA: HyaD/HybD family hydrogenase maturation endopeptidase [Paraburkholderia sp.]|nr:HyaD/HybD family hydrogenase maturation endopeptidase [Paraburkholderia sp.]